MERPRPLRFLWRADGQLVQNIEPRYRSMHTDVHSRRIKRAAALEYTTRHRRDRLYSTVAASLARNTIKNIELDTLRQRGPFSPELLHSKRKGKSSQPPG